MGRTLAATVGMRPLDLDASLIGLDAECRVLTSSTVWRSGGPTSGSSVTSSTVVGNVVMPNLARAGLLKGRLNQAAQRRTLCVRREEQWLPDD
jgi:hypothetical protein